VYFENIHAVVARIKPQALVNVGGALLSLTLAITPDAHNAPHQNYLLLPLYLQVDTLHLGLGYVVTTA
jgi:hypothetical protein